MSSFPGSPRVLKGAIIGFDESNPLASVIVFQYNPDTMTRTLRARTAEDDKGRGDEEKRVRGAPVENIKMEVEIDATDQLEKGEAVATSLGVYPQLSALEMLLYPKSRLVITNTLKLLKLGKMEISPPTRPLTLLVWGYKRVVPVRLEDFTITEEAHDTSLNPIRARCSLGLRVLSYSDLNTKHPGYYVFLAHHVVKETMATIGGIGNVAAVIGGGVDII